MAGENEGKDNLEFSNTSTACNFNLARLRERVKDYIDKVNEKNDCSVPRTCVTMSSS